MRTRTRWDGLNEKQARRIRILLSALELSSDLSHAMVTLYVLPAGGQKLLIVGQAQPETGFIPHQPIETEQSISLMEEPLVWRSIVSCQPITGKREWALGVFLDMQVYPFLDEDGQSFAAVSFEAGSNEPDLPDQSVFIEMAYRFLNGLEEPVQGKAYNRLSPRDGLLIVEKAGRIIAANDTARNIFSVLGASHIVGRRISDRQVRLGIVRNTFFTSEPAHAELEKHNMVIAQRTIPILLDGNPEWVVAVLTDVTELKKKEQELLIKSAVIQEIHHRVKNNLQTIASLLRLQARRSESVEVKAALQETINRILSISVVHEFLSQQDEEVIDVAVVARNIFNVIIDNMLDPSVELRTSFEGGTIILPSWQATSIALMINELTQNAIEHAFTGRSEGFIGVRMTADESGCGVEIYDDGVGLPDNFTIGSTKSLGLQIVRTLVESDLGGRIRLFNDNGTHAVIWIPREKEGAET